MIHFFDDCYYETDHGKKEEFDAIFSSGFYAWDTDGFGNSGARMIGITDDSLNPTWGMFGRIVNNFPHSQLIGYDVLKLHFSYGDVDLDKSIKILRNHHVSYLLTNQYCFTDDSTINVDGFWKAIATHPNLLSVSSKFH